jgi:peptidoglycan-associated lipoprotein
VLNGIQEVTGSIPVGSTKRQNKVGRFRSNGAARFPFEPATLHLSSGTGPWARSKVVPSRPEERPVHALATLAALLAMAAGGSAPPQKSEETRGPLKASLTVPPTVDAGPEVELRITLENVSGERQSFRLEVPAASFVVRSVGGSLFYAPESCRQAWTCSHPALAQVITLEPGARKEFVEHWNLASRCVQPGSYTVAARLRAYQEVRPVGTVDAGSFEPFLIQADVLVHPGADGGRCVASAPRVEGQEADCPAGGGKLAPAYFELGQAVLTPEAMAILEGDASCIRKRGFATVVVEGNCDDRGSEETNVQLGQRRAEAVRKYLVDRGIVAKSLQTVNHGEDRPVCTEREEACWRRNRRVDVVAE